MIDAIFSGGKYDLPIDLGRRGARDNIKGGVRSLLTDYIDDLAAHGASPATLERLSSFRRSCAYTLSNYLRGIHSNAYANFSKGLDSLGIEDSAVLSASLGSEVLFRGRVNHSPADFTNGEMFHIPFRMRGKVAGQRYSFPGLPCLYLASSAYTCWVELDRPSFDVFQVAAFRPIDGSTQVIDLSRIPQQLARLQRESWFSEEEYLLYWPLLAVCSIRAREEEDPFKPEYIFPQLFLEYIQRNKSRHAGIRYASIKCENQMRDDWHTFTNFVFPSTSDSVVGKRDRKLSSLFEVAGNRSGKELQVLGDLIRSEAAGVRLDHRRTPTDDLIARLRLRERRLYTSDGKSYPYATSQFGLIELALLRETFDDLGTGPVTIGGLLEEELDDLISPRDTGTGNMSPAP